MRARMYFERTARWRTSAVEDACPILLLTLFFVCGGWGPGSMRCLLVCSIRTRTRSGHDSFCSDYLLLVMKVDQIRVFISRGGIGSAGELLC